jgi:hypothetical protein
MFSDLFSEPDYGVDQSPQDDTRITQVILYFSEPDVAELKRLAKEALKKEMPLDYIENGNLSNLYLLLLRKHYGQPIDSQANPFGQGM